MVCEVFTDKRFIVVVNKRHHFDSIRYDIIKEYEEKFFVRLDYHQFTLCQSRIDLQKFIHRPPKQITVIEGPDANLAYIRDPHLQYALQQLQEIVYEVYTRKVNYPDFDESLLESLIEELVNNETIKKTSN